MNYLAHLYLAQPNADSYFGNLLGDFGGSTHSAVLSTTVQQGLNNHYLVDKFTDQHPEIKQAKYFFSHQRRRFAGIAIDVLFDHFLIRHWTHFHNTNFTQFKQTSYMLLNDRIHAMPARMQKVVGRLTKDDWFSEYETVDGIGLALDNIAKRIRFANQFNGCIEDIHRHYDEFEAVFLSFFPQLKDHVKSQGLELNNKFNKN